MFDLYKFASGFHCSLNTHNAPDSQATHYRPAVLAEKTTPVLRLVEGIRAIA